MPGIGKSNGAKLRANNYTAAHQVLGMYLQCLDAHGREKMVLGSDGGEQESEFEACFKEIGIPARHVREMARALALFVEKRVFQQ